MHEARALLAEQVGKMTLERVADGDCGTYRAKGQIDFFGDELFAHVGGAGGPVWTVRAVQGLYVGSNLAARLTKR